MERGGGRWVWRGPQCWFFTREYTGSFPKIFIPRSSCCGSSSMCSNRLCPVLVPHPPPSVLPEPRHSCVTCLTTESLTSEGCYRGRGEGVVPQGVRTLPCGRACWLLRDHWHTHSKAQRKALAAPLSPPPGMSHQEVASGGHYRGLIWEGSWQREEGLLSWERG